MPSENFQLSPAAAKARFEALQEKRQCQKHPDDPLFRPVDADDFRVDGDNATDFSNLVENGLVRVTMPLPLNVKPGGRGAVMYRLADDNLPTNPINNRAFIDAEYNRAFVATQYFGYLRRDSDIGGFSFWLGQVNSGPLHDATKQHAMVCAFTTSAEYQQRFSSIATHSNAECQ